MIGHPFNDRTCLGAITQQLAERVEQRDPFLCDLAARYPTAAELATWIRSLPQRDDEGDPTDGPKVEACSPPQRLRVPAPDPNCVERAALYIAVAELIDPEPVRQLATVETPIGAHTFPIENGAPIVLDPRVQRNGLACGLALGGPGPVAMDSHDALEWSARLAEDEAGATNLRNGASRMRRARNAMMRLVDEGVAPAPSEVEAMGWMFALAERAARHYGRRALEMVQASAHAVTDLLDEVLARTPRNVGLEIDGLSLDAPKWISAVGDAVARIGIDVGTAAIKSQLSALGIGADMIPLVESELNREGLTLGPLAHPGRLPSFATMQQHAKRRPLSKAA